MLKSIDPLLTRTSCMSCGPWAMATNGDRRRQLSRLIRRTRGRQARRRRDARARRHAQRDAARHFRSRSVLAHGGRRRGRCGTTDLRRISLGHRRARGTEVQARSIERFAFYDRAKPLRDRRDRRASALRQHHPEERHGPTGLKRRRRRGAPMFRARRRHGASGALTRAPDLRATSTQRASLIHWSASVRSLPCAVEEKPHWWLSAHCSSGT